MDASAVASIVSASAAVIAVVVGAVLQRSTLGASERTTDKQIEAARAATLAQIEATRSNVLADLRWRDADQWTERLVGNLAEWCALSYHQQAAFHDAMAKNRAWPGEAQEMVDREDLLWTKVRLLLNPEDPTERVLVAAMDELRNHQSEEAWMIRRDAVISASSAVNTARRDRAIGHG